jgi:hypothetical protein
VEDRSQGSLRSLIYISKIGFHGLKRRSADQAYPLGEYTLLSSTLQPNPRTGHGLRMDSRTSSAMVSYGRSEDLPSTVKQGRTNTSLCYRITGHTTSK